MNEENALTVTHEEVTPSRRDALVQEVVSRATPETVPSGVLHQLPPAWSALLNLEGAVTQDQWQDALRELEGAGASGLAFDDLQSRAAAHRDRGHVPIFIADIPYETVRAHVWAAIRKIDESGEGELDYADGAKLFESRRALLASAILPREFVVFAAEPHYLYGREATFVIPADGLLGGAASLSELTVDFGDGAGPRTVRVGEPVAVSYDGYGTKTVALSGAVSASFQITLRESPLEVLPADYFSEEWQPVEATIRRPGIEVATAQAYVIRRVGKPKITNPVLLVEGFPGNYDWPTIFRYANQQSFATKFLQNGFDIILVRFPKGPVRLEANAYALIALILDVISKREGNGPLRIGGFSMGGLVARYALAYMEHQRRADPTKPHHQTHKFFTVDSPHEGANVSVSVQFIAQGIRGDGEQAKLMATPAAQQLLLQWVPPKPWKDGPIGQSPLRTEFVNELRAVGWMPKDLADTIAIADGAGDGKYNQAEPAKFATKHECGMLFWSDLFTHPLNSPGTLIAHFCHGFDSWRLTAAGGGGHDSAPGGVWEAPIFRRVYNEFPSGIVRKIEVENACFISTLSALGIPGSGSEYFKTPDLSRRSFNSVTYSWEGNRTHIELTPTLADFVYKFVAG